MIEEAKVSFGDTKIESEDLKTIESISETTVIDVEDFKKLEDRIKEAEKMVKVNIKKRTIHNQPHKRYVHFPVPIVGRENILQVSDRQYAIGENGEYRRVRG